MWDSTICGIRKRIQSPAVLHAINWYGGLERTTGEGEYTIIKESLKVDKGLNRNMSKDNFKASFFFHCSPNLAGAHLSFRGNRTAELCSLNSQDFTLLSPKSVP